MCWERSHQEQEKEILSMLSYFPSKGYVLTLLFLHPFRQTSFSFPSIQFFFFLIEKVFFPPHNMFWSIFFFLNFFQILLPIQLHNPPFSSSLKKQKETTKNINKWKLNILKYTGNIYIYPNRLKSAQTKHYEATSL